MKRKVWTQEEIDILRLMYPDHFAEEIADLLGRTKSQVYCKAHSLGLYAPKEKIIRAGRMSANHPNNVAHRFQKGMIPANKGKKMSPELYARCYPTMFKKGQPSINKRLVGSERVNVDGYIEIKVADPNKWRLKHRVIWERANGSIPPGHNIQFKNHNPLDCTLENLYIISQAEQMRTENSFMAKYPKPLQDVIRLKGAVNRQIHKQERNGKQSQP